MRFFEEKDYPIVCEWWTKRSWPLPSFEMLPKTGLIVDGVCAGFLYSTDSSISWIEFIVANPDTTKEERSEALNKIISGLMGLAKEMGYTSIISSIQHPGLMEKYKSFGFVEADVNMTNFCRRI